MFKYIREDMSQTTIRVVLGCLVVGFATWGIHGIFEPSTNLVAKYKGVSVSKTELARFINSLPDDIKNKINSSRDLSLEIEQKAVQSIIERKLFLNLLNENNFSYDPKDVKKQLLEIEGKFGDVTYYMKHHNYSDSDLLLELRSNAMFALIDSGFEKFATEWPSTKAILTKSITSVKNIQVIPVDVVVNKPSEESLKAYYENNKHLYFVPELAKITETTFSTEKYKKSLKVTDKILLDFYNSHIDWYFKNAYLIADVYPIVKGKFTDTNSSLSQEQVNELKANGQSLGAKANRIFGENVTEPALYNILRSLDIGGSEFTTIDDKEVVVILKSKHDAVTPEFSKIKAQVESDYRKDKLREISDKLREGFLNISRGGAYSLDGYNDFLIKKDLSIEHSGLEKINGVGSYKFEELDNGDLVLIRLNQVTPKLQLNFSDAYRAVKKDYNAWNKDNLALSKAQEILSKRNLSLGHSYEVSFDTEPFLGLDLEKIMTMQFYNGQDSKILKASDGKYYVLFLKGVTQKDRHLGNFLSGANDMKYVFTRELVS